ncbi:uncharacterized protein LOC132949860 [Metopolophium dirhodum]|uniref:uncharacterized protein LOC132949860 n=1 Tax=Metopolophium dirhodum TaxID=44670 RepID=UPI00298F8C4E|nr:uncharacterized protein LOC132949860 [Metopolophium dirhodum]
MDIRDDRNHVFNITLAKLMGLYQTLDPGSFKICRGQSVYHVVAAFIALCLCVFGILLNVSGVYYWTDNMPLSIDYHWKAFVSLYLFYQTCIVIYYSDDIWNCLSITCYGFTSNSLRDRHILDRWREQSVLITTILLVTNITSLIIYFVSTLALSNDMLLIKNRDGSVSSYRQNLFNLYLFAPDETYNAHYYTFYLVEGSYLVSLSMALCVFDILLVTLCLAISCQMEMICTAFESVGHKSLGGDISLVDYRDEIKETLNEQDLIYDELKTIIMDHQAVMKIYDEFLSIFERVLLTLVIVLSIMFIVVWFCFIMSFSGDDRFRSSGIFTVKMFCAIPPYLFKLFAVCYLFGNLHDQKDSIIFALYSSNWTEMDMKCKQLILLTMKLNNANQKKLKFTRTKIVNLEMFFKTTRDSYSILSVLINYIKNKV